MAQANINIIAVLTAAVINMALGMLWYSPFLFGKMWMKAIGWSQKELEKAKKKGMQKTYLLAFVSGVVMVYVLAIFVDYAQAATMVEGAITGFWLWLGFVATTSLTTYIFEGKHIELYLINTVFNLFSLMIAGALLAVWV